MSLFQDFTDKTHLLENHTLLLVHIFHIHVLYYGCNLHPALSAVVMHAIYHLKQMILDKICQEQEFFR